MGQVPKISRPTGVSSTAITSQKTIGIIGDGRLAKNLLHWFELKGLSVVTASRRSFASSGEKSWSSYLANTFSECGTVVVAVSDAALAEVVANLKDVFVGAIVHGSGSQFLAGTSTWHPLFTFTDRLLTEAQYDAIHFVGTRESVPFRQLFPALTNSYSRIEKEQLPLYHALCVVAGNFTTLLWDILAKSFEADLELSPAVAIPYLQAITSNIESGLQKSRVDKYLTGPIARGDTATIQTNLTALQNHPAAALYQAFLDMYDKQKGRNL